MMRPLFFYTLGIATCLVMAGTQQPPNQKDYIQQQISEGIAKRTDSLWDKISKQDTTISTNTSKIIPAIKEQVDENKRLKEELAFVKKERDFYKSIAQNPVIIKKALPSDSHSDYITEDNKCDTVKVYLKKKWLFGRYVETTKN